MITAKENRRTFLRFLPAGVFLLALPWLSGCAERVELGSEPVPGITPASSARTPDGMAGLYLLNDMVTMFGLVKHPAKIVDGNGRRAIVDLEPRKYARFFVSPGPHTLKLLSWGSLTEGVVIESTTINADPGKTYYVAATATFAFAFGELVSFGRISENRARSLMKSMTPQ